MPMIGCWGRVDGAEASPEAGLVDAFDVALNDAGRRPDSPARTRDQAAPAHTRSVLSRRTPRAGPGRRRGAWDRRHFVRRRSRALFALLGATRRADGFSGRCQGFSKCW